MRSIDLLKEAILVETGSWLTERDEIPSFPHVDKNGNMMLCEFGGDIGIERGKLIDPWMY